MNGTQPLEIASLVVTFFAAAALTSFAWLTYRHTKKVTELRFSPVLEISSVSPPKTGSFAEGKCTYHGVKWDIYLTNSGEVPILARDISVDLQVSPTDDTMEGIWTRIGKFCELVDEEGNVLSDRTIGVNGRSQRKITVYLCQGDKRGRKDHKLFRPGDKAFLSIGVFQTRGLSKESGWLIVERSESFEIPDKFGKEIPVPTIY